MVEIGKYNTLRVVKILDFGAYLDGEEEGEILLPLRYMPTDCAVDDQIKVFLYFDSEDRLIATTSRPFAQVGEFASLRVNSVNKVGAFLDWGLMKDILVPFREQKITMKEDSYYVVYVYLDQITQRIVASAKIDKFIDNIIPEYTYNQKVNLLIVTETDLGYKVIINNLHWGMLYHNEIYVPLYKGDVMTGYVKQVRPDEKIDVSLQPLGFDRIEPLAQTILDILHDNDNYLPLGDKSSVEEIAHYFACSKKAFKKAIGTLYKQKMITILENGIKTN